MKYSRIILTITILSITLSGCSGLGQPSKSEMEKAMAESGPRGDTPFDVINIVECENLTAEVRAKGVERLYLAYIIFHFDWGDDDWNAAFAKINGDWEYTGQSCRYVNVGY